LPIYTARDTLVVGCDSMLSIGGSLVGKPHTPEVARKRWAEMAGGTGELLTGHAVLRLSGDAVTAEASDTRTTVVRFATPPQHELDAYVATAFWCVLGLCVLALAGSWRLPKVSPRDR